MLTQKQQNQIVESILKEKEMELMVHAHLESGTPIRKNIFLSESETYADFIRTARKLYKLGKIKVDAEDKVILAKLQTGEDAIYQGRKVKLDSPTRISDGEKKFRVYVDSGKKDDEGNIIAKKIEWGAAGSKVKNYDDEARKSFLARHQCHLKKDKKTAGWWACNIHRFADQLGLKSDKPW